MTLTGTGATRTLSSINAPDFNSTSDARLKENLEKLDNAVEKVMKMTGYRFNFINDAEKTKHYGVVAQEIAEVTPELVSETKDHLSVSYMGLVPLLIEAIKEQQKQIEELKAAIKK
jgi:ASC-1-like (ASCH) protein